MTGGSEPPPPLRETETWAPRVRLYLFRRCGEEIPRERGDAPGADRPASTSLPDRSDAVERPA